MFFVILLCFKEVCLFSLLCFKKQSRTAKNAALAEAGCRTAKSFDELGTLIEEVGIYLASFVLIKKQRRFV